MSSAQQLAPIASAHLRIARATAQLSQVVEFYRTVLGFQILGRFTDHDGFDGVMLGHPGAGYHLEFTYAGGQEITSRPGPESLLVFYIPDVAQWSDVVSSIENQGISPVPASNPYWDRAGKTYEDPDGYRVVIQNSRWVSAPM